MKHFYIFCLLLTFGATPWVSAQTLTYPTGNLQGSSTGACPSASCTGTFTDGAGNYSNNINNFWTICSANPGQCLTLTFTSFNMNDVFIGCGGCCDGMIIYDGPIIGGTVLYNGCAANPGTVTATSGCLTVRVISDGTVNYSGWTANVSCTNCAAGQVTATNSDCSYATPLCGDNFITDPSSGPGAVLEGCGGSGCILGEVYSNWYTVTVSASGTLAFNVNPQTANQDFDFELFGPYAGSPTCNSLGLPIRCSFSALTGQTGLGNGALDASEDVNGDKWVAPLNVLVGETYLIMINKWTAITGAGLGYGIDFTGTALLGSPPITIVPNSPNICTGGSVTLTVSPTGTYNWTGPAGYTATQIGAITVSPASTGTYTASIVGCPSTNSAVVTVVPVPNVSIAPPGTACVPGSVTLTASSTTPGVTYAWSGGGTGTTKSVSTSGTYYVTVTEPVNNCTASASVSVNINAVPTVAPTATLTSFCVGGSTILAANATAGSGVISTYAWSSGLAGSVSGGSVSPVANTTYTVTVTNSNLCTATGSVAVTVWALPTTAPTAVPSTICVGQNTTLAANATAGSGVISTYAWSSGIGGNVSGGIVSPIANTTYTVTVTNSHACTATGTVAVMVNAVPTAAPSATPSTICNSGSTTLAANATAGSGAITSYAWNSGLGNVAGGTVSPVTNTTYTVTVTNSNGCTASASTLVTVNANPTANPNVSPGSICNGGSTTLSANATAGSGVISTYAWSSGLVGNVSSGIVSPTTNTTYTVTVTNSNGCSVTANITMVVFAKPTVAPTATPSAICNGGSTTLAANATAGSGAITNYAWSSGLAGSVSGGIVSPVANTTYTVTVTNSNGCTASASILVTVNANPTVAPSVNPGANCVGGSSTLTANATAGSGAISTYAWSSGLAGNVASGSVSPVANTTYTVTVTNSNGCSVTGTVTLVVNANPTVAPTATPAIICVGGNTILAANATAGSGAITTYAWSSGLAGNISGGAVSPITNTTYTVTVTNSNTCTATGTVTVTVNANPTVAPTATPAAICNSGSTLLAANATAGSGAITTYAWSSGLVGNVSGGSVAPVTNTTYTVTVTNSNTCTATASVLVTVNANPTTNPTVTPGAICNGGSTTLAANATAGSGAISTYAWSSGLVGNVSSGSVSPIANTTYTVTVTNSNGCSVTGTVTVVVNANPTVAPTATPAAICNGGTSTLAANAVAGSGAITTYAWSSGLAGNVSGGIVSPVANTTYTVTVTNSNLCTVTGTVAVTVNAYPTVAPSATPAVICNGGSTTLAANATAGSGAISTYAWSTGLVGNVSGGIVSPVANTTYTVTVTNSNTCTATASILVTVNTNPTVAPSATPSTICNGQNATLAANAIAGSGAISTYSWSSGLAGNVSGGSVSPIINTTYTVTVTDANTCSATENIAVTVNANPTVAPTAAPATICNSGSTLLAANATAGSGAITTYAWSSGLAGNVSGGSVSPVTNTTYTITVTNSNTCTATANILVTVNANPTVAPTATPSTICTGGSTTLAANATAGSGAISTYAWSSGLGGNVSGGSVSPTTNTTYTVTVTNSNTCTATASVAVTVNPLPSPTASNTGPYCAASTIQLSAGGGTSYSWSGPAAFASASQNPTRTNATLAMGGTYTVTVTDANGCSATATTNVVVNSSLSPVTSNTGPYCAGGSVQLNVTGGNTYSWNGPNSFTDLNQNPVISNATTLMSGTYTVTATDLNGCSGTASTSVVVNANPTVAPTAAPTAICSGGSTSLSANAVAGSGAITTYLWSSGLAGNISGGTVSPIANTTYTVTVTNSNSCTVTATVSVTVNANPTAAPTAAPAAICNGGSTTLAANATAGSGAITTYIWSSGLAGNISGGTVSPIANTTYTVTVTNSNSCTVTGTVSVIVNGNPTVAPTAAPTAICSGGSTTLAANAIAGSGVISTYAWSSGLAGNISGGTVSPVTNTTYTVTVSNSNTCTATANVLVTVNANPTVAPTATPVVICNGGSTTLASNATAGSGAISTYAWSSGLAGNISSGSVSPVTNTTYTITVTNSNSCTVTGTVSVTVNANPTVAPTVAPITICNGGSTTLTANATAGSGAVSTYAWSSGLVGNISGGTVSPIANTTYTVTVTNSNSCTVTGTVSVTVNANPTVAPTAAPIAICNGGSTTLAANATAGSGAISTYAWGSGLAGNISGGSVSPVANTTYTVTVTNSNSCTVTGTVSVTVNTNPTVAATAAPIAICNGGSTTLAANAVVGSGAITTYAWSSSLAGNVSGGTVSPVINTTYTVTVTDANTCTATGTVAVNVGANSTVAPTATPAIICNGGSTTLAANATAGSGIISTYAWSTGLIGSVSGGTVSPITNTTYTVTVTNSNTCTATASVLVTVNANPTVSPTAAPAAICNGASTTLSANATAGSGALTTYAWSSGLAGNVSGGTVSPVVNTTYTVTVTNSNSCTVTGTISVTVNANPTVAPTAAPSTICNGQSTTLSSNTTAGSGVLSTYAWSSGLVGSFSGGSVSPTTNTTYTVTVTNSNTCTVTGSVSVTVNPLPSPIAGNTGPYCAGATIQLSSSGGTSYSWSGPNVYASANQNPSIANSTLAMSGVYSVTVTDANGCSATASTNVVVNALPTPSASNTGPYCTGSTIQLNSSGGSSYSWSGPAAFVSAIQNPTRANATLATAGAYNVTVTDANGCSATASTNVTLNSSLSPVASNTGPYCAGGTIQLNVVVPATTFSWSGPAAFVSASQNPAIPNATVLMGGNYSVTATDLNGCSGTASTTVVVNPLPIPSASNTGPYCVGATIQLNSSGGNTYSWSGPNVYANATQNPTISNSTVAMSGVYSVTVTDVNSCSATALTNVVVNALPSPSASNTGPFCTGTSVQLNANGGASYLWAGPNLFNSVQQNPAIANATVTMTGVYSVTVIDANSCSATVSTSVTVIPLMTLSTAVTNVSCNGGTSGAINFTVNSGQSPYTFLWSNSAVTQNISGVAFGNYTVTVTDNATCTATTTANISEPAALSAGETHVDILCNGGSTGSITITPTGGTNPLSFSWNDGPVTQNRTNLSAGSYTVTVTDNNLCTASVSATLTQPTAQTLSETHIDVTCGGASPGGINVSNSGGVSPYTYLWNDGVNTPVRPSVTAGNYTLTVTDNNACTATIAVVINSGSGLTLNATHTDVLCNGGNSATINTTASGGSGPYTFIWNDAANTQNRTNLVVGTYTVTANDAGSCSATASISIIEPSAFSATITHTDVACNGGSIGTITISPSGGTLPYTFLWSDGNTSQNRSFVAAGNYSVTGTDNNSCTFSISTVVLQPNALSVVQTHTDVLCNGQSTGAVNLNVAGGTAPYTYVWNDGNTLPNRINIPAANYSVTVTDNNLCSVSVSASVIEPAALTLSSTHIDVLCNSGSTGSITTTTAGGTIPYNYTWNDAVATPNRTTLTAGNYTLTVQDNNTCSATVTVTVTEPTALNVSETHTPVLCNGGNTGSIDLTVSGATSPYTFIWNDAVNTEDRLTVSVGNYSVTVNDNNACSSALNINITEPTALNLSEAHIDVACSGGNTGSIDITVNGATGPYQYIWNDGITTEDRTAIGTGNYSITVSDNNSCSSSLAVAINSASGLSISETHTNVSCNALTDASINITVLGGSVPYTYLWNDAVITQNRTGIAAGNYTISVTDNNACVISLSILITEPTVLSVSETHSPVLCNGGSTGSINITSTGASAPYTFAWNDAVVTEDRNNIAAGNYSVTVNDINSCTASLTVNITEPSAISFTETHVNVLCNGGATGSIDAITAGGTSPYTYVWNDAVATEDRSNITAGSYAVTVNDNNACTASLNITISQPSAVAATELHSDVSCNGGTDASITLNVSGGTSPYNFNWNDAVVTQNRNNITAENYSVTVNDNNACSVSLAVSIAQPTVLSTTETHTSVSCNGYHDGAISITVTGGTAPYAYLWNDGITTPNRTNLTSASYSVAVNDANGCTAVNAAQLTNPNGLVMNAAVVDNPCARVTIGQIDLQVSGGVTPYTYLWNNNAVTQDISNLHAGTYSVTVTDVNGCSLTDAYELTEGVFTVNAQQSATINLGETVQLTGTATGGTGQESFVWLPDNHLTCAGCASPIASPYSDIIYVLQGTDITGCTGYDTVKITVNATHEIFIPNVFTPNGDGNNDFFEVFGNKQAWKQFEAEIFNRWGEKVYETNDMNFKWDGIFKSKPAAPSVYVYQIRVVYMDNFTDKLYKGSVTLVR